MCGFRRAAGNRELSAGPLRRDDDAHFYSLAHFACVGTEVNGDFFDLAALDPEVLRISEFCAVSQLGRITDERFVAGFTYLFDAMALKLIAVRKAPLEVLRLAEMIVTWAGECEVIAEQSV
jgi:hypothetical protein